MSFRAIALSFEVGKRATAVTSLFKSGDVPAAGAELVGTLRTLAELVDESPVIAAAAIRGAAASMAAKLTEKTTTTTTAGGDK
jgi:hypothetical protein